MIYDFVIVGAGIAGASVAYELARHASVCLLEGESRPGFHATGRSAALFTPTYGGREIRAVTRASRGFFDQPPADFCEHPLLTPRGCLYIARPDQVVRLEQMAEAIRVSGGTVSVLEVAQAMARVPLIRRGYLAAAALDSDSMDIDVDALVQGFLRGARALGATLITGALATSIHQGQGIWSVDVGGRTVEAPVIINAAGAWADSVAQACGARRIGLQPLRRTALLVDAPAGIDIRDWPAVIDADEEFYFKPDRTQLMLSPADEIPQPPGERSPRTWMWPSAWIGCSRRSTSMCGGSVTDGRDCGPSRRIGCPSWASIGRRRDSFGVRARAAMAFRRRPRWRVSRRRSPDGKRYRRMFWRRDWSRRIYHQTGFTAERWRKRWGNDGGSVMSGERCFARRLRSMVGFVALWWFAGIGPAGVASAASEAALEAAAKVEWHWGVRIPLRDGVELSATAYLPAGRGPRPCVFTLTPYIAQSYPIEECILRPMGTHSSRWMFAAAEIRRVSFIR